MAKFDKKISNLVNQQVPEFVLSDHPKFLEFLKTYFTFMESAELILTSIQVTEGIQLETETAQENNLILNASRLDSDKTQLDAGSKLLLEDTSYGSFQRGETLTGATSGATATVLSEDLVNGRIYISAQDKFLKDEVVTGGTSTASATISNYRPNPVTNIQELLNFRDPDKVISNFLTKFRNEFLNTLPETLDSGVNKRNLIKNIKSLYRAKGSTRGHQAFFRLLFNLDSTTIYPKEQMLRVSDGQWDTQKILRAIATTGDTLDLIGRTITGVTSDATAIIENVYKFQIGADEVTEFVLNEDSISGTFQTSEVVRGTSSDTSDVYIKATTTGIPNVISITNDGGLLSASDTVSITGGGSSAIINVDNIGSGGITSILIDSVGSGYAIGDDLVFTNTGTNGGSVTAKVSVVNGGIAPESGTSGTSSTDHIILENETVKGDTYTGDKIIQDAGTGNEDITDIRIINSGWGFTSLPTATITSSGGSSATIIPYGTEIGRVLNLKKVETGSGYEASPTPPTLSLPSYLIIKDKSGTFTVGETITGWNSSSTVISATVVSYTSTNNILKVSGATGSFMELSTITGGSSSVTATVLKNDTATATVTIGSVVDTAGSYLNQDGHISETTMKVQDSLYYQDYSYVLRVGRSINDWRDSFKKTMHTAGYYFTGRVDIQTQVDAKLRAFTTENSGISVEGVLLTLNTLFSTIFGRRLGTIDDGTTLRSNPELGVDPDFTDSTVEHFTPNTRDLTLKRATKLSFPTRARITVRSTDTLLGYAYAGPTMNTINKFAFTAFSGSGGRAQTSNIGGSSDSTVTTAVAPMQISNWNNFRLTGTHDTSIDGEIVQMGDFAVNRLKTNLAIPTEITES